MTFSVSTATSREIMSAVAPSHDLHSVSKVMREASHLVVTCSCGSELLFDETTCKARGLELAEVGARLLRLAKFVASERKVA